MLNEKLEKYISESGYKYGAIAEAANIPAPAFYSMMRGVRKITAEEYFAICTVLNVPLNYFAENTA